LVEEKQGQIFEMKIVVDTNIIFSALLSPSGKISDLILNSSGLFDFMAPNFVFEELGRHRIKLLKISNYNEQQLDFLMHSLFKNIVFIDLEYISEPHWVKAIELVKDVDQFDAPFVALSLETNALLWTGDFKLVDGLMKSGFENCVKTDFLTEFRESTDKF
jgi:predicted nucleic acid-binding protein